MGSNTSVGGGGKGLYPIRLHLGAKECAVTWGVISPALPALSGKVLFSLLREMGRLTFSHLSRSTLELPSKVFLIETSKHPGPSGLVPEHSAHLTSYTKGFYIYVGDVRGVQVAECCHGKQDLNEKLLK